MFALIESCPESRPGFGWTGKIISLLAHAFVISVAAALTRSAINRAAGYQPRIDTPVWQVPVPDRGTVIAPPLPGRLNAKPVLALPQTNVDVPAMPVPVLDPAPIVDPGFPG